MSPIVSKTVRHNAVFYEPNDTKPLRWEQPDFGIQSYEWKRIPRDELEHEA